MDVTLGFIALLVLLWVVNALIKSAHKAMVQSSNNVRNERAFQMLMEGAKVDDIKCTRTRAAKQVEYKVKREVFLAEHLREERKEVEEAV